MPSRHACLASHPAQSDERVKETRAQKLLGRQRARTLREQKHEQGFERSHAAHDALVAQKTAAATSYRRAQNGREAEYLRQSQVRNATSHSSSALPPSRSPPVHDSRPRASSAVRTARAIDVSQAPRRRTSESARRVTPPASRPSMTSSVEIARGRFDDLSEPRNSEVLQSAELSRS